MTKLASLTNFLRGMNFALVAFGSYLTKMLIIPPTFPDSIALLGLCGLVGYSLYMKAKTPVPLNDQVMKELQILKDSVSSLKMERAVVTNKNARHF